MEKIRLKKLKKPTSTEGLTPEKIRKKRDFQNLALRIILIIIIFPVFIWSLYLLVQNLSTDRPEIEISACPPGGSVFKPISPDEINRRLDKEKSLSVIIKATARADYYQTLDGGSRMPRNYLMLEIEDSQGNPAVSATVILKPEKKNRDLWTGEAVVTLNKNNKDFKIGEFIRATRTNSSQTASLITTRLHLGK